MFDDQHDLLRKAADDHKEYEAEMERDRNWDVEPVCNGGAMSKEAREALEELQAWAERSDVPSSESHLEELSGLVVDDLDRLDELETGNHACCTLKEKCGSWHEYYDKMYAYQEACMGCPHNKLHHQQTEGDNTKLKERIAELERRGRHQSIVPRIKLYRELNPGATLKEAKERVESGWKPAATNSEQELTKSRQQVELLIGILSNLRTPADMAGMTFSNHPENEKAWHEWLDKQEDKT